jgi:predicted nuclease with RNAse H fold
VAEGDRRHRAAGREPKDALEVSEVPAELRRRAPHEDLGACVTAATVRVVGIDWSCSESKRGVAIVDCAAGRAHIVELLACTPKLTAVQVIARSLSATEVPHVLAIDAPLGWPVGLAQCLTDHAAGEGLTHSADQMFSRDTDRVVQETLKKRPLEVGANLIARTAHSAIQFLCDLRRETSRAIPLLWSPDDVRDVGVIEVYPAATKIAVNGISVIAALGLSDGDRSYETEHVRDALWCAATGLHFIRGECHPPVDEVTSRREGWIWFPRGSFGRPFGRATPPPTHEGTTVQSY